MPAPVRRPTIDAGDLDLALRYLPDHQVVVVAEALDADALVVVVADCAYVGASLVIILEVGATAARSCRPDATAFEAPDADPDGLFGRTIGRFAAALDQGVAGRGGPGPGDDVGPAGRRRRPEDGQAGSISSGPLLRTLLTSGRTGIQEQLVVGRRLEQARQLARCPGLGSSQRSQCAGLEDHRHPIVDRRPGSDWPSSSRS